MLGDFLELGENHLGFEAGFHLNIANYHRIAYND
jgi:hypothetical protein